MANAPGRARTVLVLALIFGAVLVAYAPAIPGKFVWDDDLHLTENPVLQPGGLLRTWVPGFAVNYWPLTFTVYRVEYAFWGLNPIGFHVVNILLHAACAVLVWRVLLRLGLRRFDSLRSLKAPSTSRGGALFAAMLFALHPVNVESVAWIAQLKNILSLLFALVAVLLFLQHEERPSGWKLGLSVGVFFLSTLSKGPMLAGVPIVLLACAWWRRGAITGKDVLRVAPFVAVTLAMIAVEWIWPQHMRLEGPEVRAEGLAARAAGAGWAVWFYLWKLVWPAQLLFVYPKWHVDARSVLSWLPALALVLLFAVALWQRRTTWGRTVATFLACYVGLLAPVLGFVAVYFMLFSLVADHYQYAAMIVPCAAVSGGAAAIVLRWPGLRRAGYVLGAAVLATLGFLSFRQAATYSDAETLYRATLEGNPDCWMVRNNLGNVLFESGRVDEALRQYDETLRLRPDYPEAHNNLGNALFKSGETPEAFRQYEKALALAPDFAEAHNDYGVALSASGRISEAIEHYESALRLKPDYPDARVNLGNALLLAGRGGEAVPQFEEALHLSPDMAEAHNGLANALGRGGRIPEAISHCREAVRLNPDYPEAHCTLGNLLAQSGRYREAVEQYREALRLRPDYPQARRNLDAVLRLEGRQPSAPAHP